MIRLSVLLFLVAFVVSFFVQALRLIPTPVQDMSVWAGQAMWVQMGDHREFDLLQAYGHPGGPFIEAGIALHTVLGVTYYNAVDIFLITMNALFIAGSMMLAYYIYRNKWWSVAVATLLAFHPLLRETTPPSLLVSYASAFYFLLTFYLYKYSVNAKIGMFALWAITAGFVVATRTDIGTLLTATFGLLLLYRYGVLKSLGLLAGAFASFVVFDPFMWFMPVRHVHDLIAKVVLHYAEFPNPSHLNLLDVVSFSALTFISILLAVVFIFFRKKVQSPVPVPLTISLIILTGILYTVFLTATYEAVRYFVPIIFIWESLLPLFVLHLVSQVHFTSIASEKHQMQAQNIAQGLIVFLIVWNPIFLTLSLLFGWGYT